MGLVDKLKNIFTEEVEEEEEIKVEQIKKEVRSVPIESPSVERVRPTRREKTRIPEEIEEEEPEVEEKTKSPVFFTDRDFEDLVPPKRSREKEKAKEKVEKVEEPKKEEAPKPYGGHYSSTTIVQRDKQNFKPTPIISPVYGVLDKNYHKEDIIDRNETSHDSVDGLSVDSIRNKAYGTLEDDLEDTISAKPILKPVEQEDDIDLFDELEQSATFSNEESLQREPDVRKLEEITMDLTQELDNLLKQKEKDREKEKSEASKKKTKSEKEESITESDLFNLIDSMYEEGEDEE